MAEVTINYRDAAIATMDASGTKTLQTQGKYCEDDIEIVYDRPSGGIDMDEFATTGLNMAVVLSSTPTIRMGAFAYQPITGCSGPNVTTINAQAFDNCTDMEYVNFPNLTTIVGEYAFRKVNSLRVAHFPKLTTATGAGLFYQTCYGTPQIRQLIVVLPKISNLGSTAFRQGLFQAIDIGPDLTTLNSDTFYVPGGWTTDANKVTNVAIFRYTGGVVASSNIDRINGLCDVYVPSSLISAYESAPNWSTRFNAGKIIFHAIEGSIYENAYADGTPIT